MAWEVLLIESERGWGSKVDDIYYFKNKQNALKYVMEFNAKNNLATVPDWYMYATDPHEVPDTDKLKYRDE